MSDDHKDRNFSEPGAVEPGSANREGEGPEPDEAPPGGDAASASVQANPEGDREPNSSPVRVVVLLVAAIVAAVVLWTFVFPWVMTLLPENF